MKKERASAEMIQQKKKQKTCDLQLMSKQVQAK